MAGAFETRYGHTTETARGALEATRGPAYPTDGTMKARKTTDDGQDQALDATQFDHGPAATVEFVDGETLDALSEYDVPAALRVRADWLGKALRDVYELEVRYYGDGTYDVLLRGHRGDS